MGGSQPGADVAVEEFAERYAVPPVRVLLEGGVVAEDGAAAPGIAHEDAGEPPGQLVADLAEAPLLPGAGGAFHGEAVAVVTRVGVERLDPQVVERQPHRPGPAGVAGET